MRGGLQYRHKSPALPCTLLLITLLGLPAPALANPGQEQLDKPLMSGTKRTWDYPEFSTAEWVTTGLFLGVTIAMQFIPPLDVKLNRGLLVDDDVRDAIAVLDLEDQRTVRTVSDVLLTVITAYPYLVDSLVVAAWYRRSPRVAKQMALINMQTLAVTLGITSAVKVAVSRARPYSGTGGRINSPHGVNQSG